MGAQAWPFNYATTGDPAYTAQQLRQLSVAPFVAMGSSGRPLGAKSGIRVGTPSSVATITGSGPYSWNIGDIAGVIDGEANAAAGPYTYSFDTTQTGTIAAAGAAARVDRVDVVISDSDEGDGSGAKTVTCVYTQGPATGGGTPAAPARSHRLFLINVPTTGAPTIQWAPDWSGDPGEWTFNTYTELTGYTTTIGAANVPASQTATILADPTTGLNGEYVWTGSAWLSTGSSFTITTAPTTTLFGPIPPAGTRIFRYDGILTIATATNSNGDTNILYPFTAANGIISAHLNRYNYTSLGFSTHILASSQSLTQLNFRIYGAGGTGISGGAGFEYAATILYW